METQTKTPVEIVQELIAIHTTRKEASEKLNAGADEQAIAAFTAAFRQSDEFIAELMNELSEFGDGVAATADRENEYQTLYTDALGHMDTMPVPQRMQTFQALEQSLKSMYGNLLATNNDLPDSLQILIQEQEGKL